MNTPMDQRLWRQISNNLKNNTDQTQTKPLSLSLSLKSLSTLHSLITNPTTSGPTLSLILTTLTTLSPHTHHTISLLSSLNLHRPSLHLTPTLLSLSTSLLTSPTTPPRLATAVLSLLLSLPAVDFDSIDDGVLVGVAFRPCVATRVWFLRNCLRVGIKPNLVVTVLLGFTKDPYPNVRSVALEGLAGVCESGVVVEDESVVDACYFRAVELLRDRDDHVRLAAVRAASEWGRMLAASKKEGVQRDWYDAVFLQICSMVRDMNVRVRVEAFSTLGKFAYVSEDILLQSLSKKVLKAIKEKQSLSLCGANQYEIHAATAAGIFIHGPEDEFSEVQRAACISLRMLPVVSGQFAGEAVNFLIFLLNDDSLTVRIEALKTVHHMVISGCVKIQETTLEMLLGALVENHPQIRSTAISILGSVKLPDLELSKLTFESLLRSLDKYPKSEAEIFHTLFSVGRNHAKYAVSIIEDFHHEIKPSRDEKFGCTSHRVAGLIVLAISASLNNEKYHHRIPPKIFSYALAYFGRIYHAFGDVLDKDSFLKYLCHRADWCFEANSESVVLAAAPPAATGQHQVSVDILNALKLILAPCKNLWALVKSGCTSEVLKALRCCKQSLVTLRGDSVECAGAVAFACQYIRILKHFSKIWEHFAVSRKCLLYKMGELEFLFKKVDEGLLAIRYRFVGFDEQDELSLLELMLLSYVLRLACFQIHCRTLQKLSATLTYVDYLRSSKSSRFSDFVNQLAELSSKGSFCVKKTSCSILELKKLCDVFVLKELTLTRRIRHIHAELVVTGFDLVTPLHFITGLPVGIPLELTLYNVTNEHALWLRMTLVDGLTEFVFLDVEEDGGNLDVRQVKFTLPFYKTPKAGGFALRITVGMECVSEDLRSMRYGGPKHALTYLTPETEVYFVNYTTNVNQIS